jgi:hypothetical protein
VPTTDRVVAGAAGVGDVRVVVEGVRAVMARFDAAVVTVSEAQVLVVLFDEVERMGAGRGRC